MSDCLFCKIIAGEIPVDKLYEDDDVIAFWDISPQAPKHFLVIPKKHIAKLSEMTEGDATTIGKVVQKGTELAKEQGVGDNFRAVFNNGEIADKRSFTSTCTS